MNLFLTPKSTKNHNSKKKSQIPFCLKNKWYHAKVLLERFHLNGHTIGFSGQSQKLELHNMSPLLTLGVKGLNIKDKEKQSLVPRNDLHKEVVIPSN